MASPKAQIEKEKGNAAFKLGDYPNAIGHYSAAILADRKDHTLPLNRAAAYLKLGKNEDAERDCTTVLNLSAFNAKALFRRGQARLGMEKLDEAQADLTQALKREPANESVKQEVQKVTDLLEKKKTKGSKSKLEPLSSASTPKRRRVPITIVDSSESAVAPAPPRSQEPPRSKAKPAAPEPTPKIAIERESLNTDTLTPVSTRSLQPAQPTPSAAPSTPSATTAPAPSTPTPAPSAPKAEQPRTFKDAKQARESGKPSRVGGGIFRASGDSTMFPSRNSPAEPSSPKQESSKLSPTSPMNVDLGDELRSVSPEKPPTTLFEFAAAWDDAASSTAERWGLILSVPPSHLPALFKTSLEPALLISILSVFLEVLRRSPNAAAKVREYLDAFARVERFGTIVMFLSRGEKAVAREAWEALGAAKEDVDKVWRAVWV